MKTEDDNLWMEKAHAARQAWMERRCIDGWYPDTWSFDYGTAIREAEERGVSYYQVLYEFYHEPDPQPIGMIPPFMHQVKGAYCVRDSYWPSKPASEVEVNQRSYHDWFRIPGFGPRFERCVIPRVILDHPLPSVNLMALG